MLDYFSNATHLGLTATPKETKEVSNITYFGEPLSTYSLKQGIEDGFLAPYKVIRIVTAADALGYVPEADKTDKYGQIIEQRQYNTKDFDRNLVLEKRTALVARRVWEYLQATTQWPRLSCSVTTKIAPNACAKRWSRSFLQRLAIAAT